MARARVPKIRLYLLFAAGAFKASAFLIFLTPLDMEDAIKTLVTTFVKSSKGKDNLNSKSFQKLVSTQLSGMMEVRAAFLLSTDVTFSLVQSFIF